MMNLVIFANLLILNYMVTLLIQVNLVIMVNMEKLAMLMNLVIFMNDFSASVELGDYGECDKIGDVIFLLDMVI